MNIVVKFVKSMIKYFYDLCDIKIILTLILSGFVESVKKKKKKRKEKRKRIKLIQNDLLICLTWNYRCKALFIRV